MDHIFIMMQTTSFNKPKLTRIDALRTDDKGNQIVSANSGKRVGEGKDAYRDLLSPLQDVILNPQLGSRYIIVSYFGQDFYREVLHDACKQAKIPPLLTRSWIGVEQLAWPLAFDNKLKDRSLESLAEFLNIGSNDALWSLYSCYWTLMRRITTGIMLEEKARTHGGPIFEIAQQLVRQF